MAGLERALAAGAAGTQNWAERLPQIQASASWQPSPGQQGQQEDACSSEQASTQAAATARDIRLWEGQAGAVVQR